MYCGNEIVCNHSGKFITAYEGWTYFILINKSDEQREVGRTKVIDVDHIIKPFGGVSLN